MAKYLTIRKEKYQTTNNTKRNGRKRAKVAIKEAKQKF